MIRSTQSVQLLGTRNQNPNTQHLHCYKNRVTKRVCIHNTYSNIHTRVNKISPKGALSLENTSTLKNKLKKAHYNTGHIY